MGWTAEELAEMARADAEVEAEFRLTNEDLEFSRSLDRYAVLDGMDAKQRKLAEYQRAYREANRDANRLPGAEIKAARKARGYTQKELAGLLGVSRAALSLWETGALAPNWDRLCAVLPELEEWREIRC